MPSFVVRQGFEEGEQQQAGLAVMALPPMTPLERAMDLCAVSCLMQQHYTTLRALISAPAVFVGAL